MIIPVNQLPSAGFGYNFPTITIKPMTFLDVIKYTEDYPKDDDPLIKYLYDLDWVMKDDDKIKYCYLLDVDFLIFYKKLGTVSSDMSYSFSIKCPKCGKSLNKTLVLDKDIHFKQFDERIMKGAAVKLAGHTYDTIVPTLSEFMSVFNVYLRYRKVTDLKIIKIISLFKDFAGNGSNQIESDILNATHSDITLLLALQDLYFDGVEPITMVCPDCARDGKGGEVTVGVDNLISGFLGDIIKNCPITGDQIIFK